MFICACSDQPAEIENNNVGLVASISETSISSFKYDPTSKKPLKIDICDFNFSAQNNEFTVQPSKKGKSISNSLVAKQIHAFTNLSSSEEFGQFEYKWVHENVTCNLSIHEGDDIFELWCRR